MMDYRDIAKALQDARSNLTNIGYEVTKHIEACENPRNDEAAKLWSEAEDKLDEAWFAISDAVAAIAMVSRL